MDTLSPEHILSEVRKLQYLCSLKEVIRYDQERSLTETTESVAEHTYSMHILALYFLPLEDPDGMWDKEKILTMITLHDVDEIETGDILSQHKTPEIRASEAAVLVRVIQTAPEHIRESLQAIVEEYGSKQSQEAKFVKAIDVVEPLFHLYNEKWKLVSHKNKTTLQNSINSKEPYIRSFAHLSQFTDVLHEVMDREGYFYSPEREMES